MKLYTFPTAPSPQRVHIFLHEKGIELATEFVDMKAQAQLTQEYRAINPRCTVPALVLSDGTVISEVIAICHYLEAEYSENPLFGNDPKQRALISEWDHRVELECLLAIADVLRNRSKAYQNRALPGALDLEQVPELVPRGLTRIQSFFATLDTQLSRHKFVAGDTFSMADITAHVAVGFACWVKVDVPEQLGHLRRWRQETSSRPSIQSA